MRATDESRRRILDAARSLLRDTTSYTRLWPRAADGGGVGEGGCSEDQNDLGAIV
jgi:hypothetical protein